METFSFDRSTLGPALQQLHDAVVDITIAEVGRTTSQVLTDSPDQNDLADSVTQLLHDASPDERQRIQRKLEGVIINPRFDVASWNTNRFNTGTDTTVFDQIVADPSLFTPVVRRNGLDMLFNEANREATTMLGAVAVHYTPIKTVEKLLIAPKVIESNGGSYDTATDGGSGETQTVLTTPSTIRFRINSVRCIQDTWEKDRDEISIGGIAVGPDGSTTKIVEHEVYGGVEKGDIKSYNPPWPLHQWPQVTISSPPAVYVMNLLLSETDSSGFNDAISAVYEQIKPKVDELVKAVGMAAGAAVGTWVGGAVGSVVPGVGTIVGAIVGAAIAAGLKKLFDWLFGKTPDFVFPVASLAVSLGAAATEPAQIGPQTHTFTGEGGVYSVGYSWALTP